MALNYPEDLRYLDSHEYIRLDGTSVTVGLSTFALDELGDLVFVDLPEVGADLTAGQTCGSIESVKAVEDLYSPLTGKVIARNEGAIDDPEIISGDPYGDGWLLKIEMSDPNEVGNTLSADEYRSRIGVD